MKFETIIVLIMVFFALVGIVDKIVFKDKFGYGPRFQEGIEAMGPIALAVIGIVSLVPIISLGLKPIMTPIFTLLGADPSMFATTFIAMDMGGFQLAREMANDPEVGMFAAVIYGSMMGPTICFTIPVALTLIQPEDKNYFAKGILYGILTIPVGAFVGGLLMGLNITALLLNLIPAVIITIIIAVALIFIPNRTIKAFKAFATFVGWLALVGLVLAVFNYVISPVLGDKFYDLPILGKMAPVEDGILIAGYVAIMLCGALPFVTFLMKVLSRPFKVIGHRLGLSDTAVTGLIATVANNIATLKELKNMKPREKVINTAFLVSAAFTIGDHLAFTSANAKEFILPMMAGKLVAGVLAVVVAIIFLNLRGEQDVK